VSARPELGIAFQTDKEPAEYARLARLAEAGGFDVVSVYHDLFFAPAIGALTLVAQATERVRLGPAALNPFTLHPVEIAGQIAFLDAVSGGRAYLGLARGAWLDELRLDTGRPLTALREAVEVVRRLLRGDRSGFAGEAFALAPGAGLRYEPLRPEVPLLIGSWGERTAAFAGETADELKLGGTANPDLVPVVRARLGKGSAARLVVGSVTVVDEDGDAARARARREAALYLPVVAPLDPTVEVPDGLAHRVAALVAAGDAEAAGALIPDGLLTRFALAGTPEQVAAQAQALLEAGVDRVDFGTPQGISPGRGVELLARRVVPLLR
jgi:5,10-methylenetetrahydromethanopterin reductase